MNNWYIDESIFPFELGLPECEIAKVFSFKRDSEQCLIFFFSEIFFFAESAQPTDYHPKNDMKLLAYKIKWNYHRY